MATYVVSHIHGQYDMFIELLDKINLKETDALFVLGDILDRSTHPIKTIRKIMSMSNAICIIGNHELMALECLDFFVHEATGGNVGKLDDRELASQIDWQLNGGFSTIEEFKLLDLETKVAVINFLKKMLAYARVSVNGNNYLLVHGGLGNFIFYKSIEDYSLDELVWTRVDYDVRYFKDTYVVVGHTPTQMIKDNPKSGFIYRKNNNIAIDCGAYYGGRLAALCLDTGVEYYSSPNTQNKKGFY